MTLFGQHDNFLRTIIWEERWEWIDDPDLGWYIGSEYHGADIADNGDGTFLVNIKKHRTFIDSPSDDFSLSDYDDLESLFVAAKKYAVDKMLEHGIISQELYSGLVGIS